MATYSEEGVQQLVEQLQEIQSIRDGLFLFLHPISLTDRVARKHLDMGVLRRVSLIASSIHSIFQILPPETIEIPDKNTIESVTIHLQANIINVYGALDCWAHVWVNEFGVRGRSGLPLSKKRVGLGPKYSEVRASLTPKLRALVTQRDDWLSHLTRYRDSLAHGVPIYIPPSMVDPANKGEYLIALREWGNTLDQTERNMIDARLKKLSHFKAVCTDDPNESPILFFHSQIIANFLTIEEFSKAFAFGIYENRKFLAREAR